MAAHVAAGFLRRRGPRDHRRPVEPGKTRPERGIPCTNPAHDGVEGRHHPERAGIGRFDEQPMEREGLEVQGRVDQARGFEQCHETGRDGQRRAVAQRPEVGQRGAGEEDVPERARMDDEAPPAHADTRLLGAVPVIRAFQRGAT